MPQRINDYEKFAVHIKGMETPVVDPMGVQGYGGLGCSQWRKQSLTLN